MIARSRSLPLMLSASALAVVNGKRATRGGIGRVPNQTAVPTTAEATSAAATGVTTRCHSGLRGSGATDAVPMGAARLAAFSSTKSAVEISATRRRRSLVRQLCRSVRIAGGISEGSADQSGSIFSTFASVSLTSSPSNGRRPVSISYSTQPKAQMSLRLSASRPFACSGAM